MSLPIHIEVWIASKLLSQETEIFTKTDLINEIRALFNDTRSGVSTHISSYCVASAKANPGAYRYLTRIGRGQYRVFTAGDEVHESKMDAPLHPDEKDIPPDYKYLLEKTDYFEKAESKDDPPIVLKPKITEGEVRDYFIQVLNSRFGYKPEVSEKINAFKFDAKFGNYTCVAEGVLNYILPNGALLSHRNDILISGPEHSIAIEIKHRSAVTDQFKTRSYDALHIKKSNPNTVQIMLYVRDKSGISPSHAASICYPFDHFIHVDFKHINIPEKIEPLLTTIGNVLQDFRV